MYGAFASNPNSVIGKSFLQPVHCFSDITKKPEGSPVVDGSPKGFEKGFFMSPLLDTANIGE